MPLSRSASSPATVPAFGDTDRPSRFVSKTPQPVITIITSMADSADDLLSSGPLLSAPILDLAIGLAWPEFIEVRGCVLLASRFSEENFDTWWSRYSEHPYAIERVLNEVHFYDLVDDNFDDTQLPVLERAAIRLREAWCAALAGAFPGRRFTVEYSTEPDQYGPTVSFHQAEGCPGCAEQ